MMARASQPISLPTVSRPGPSKPAPSTAAGPDLTEAPEMCPQCRSTIYLNKSLKFKTNPVCYHILCEACVQRLFGNGPARCPTIGCKRTLRKGDFVKQEFGDVVVQKEVDVRRRLQSLFGPGGKYGFEEEDFESKMAWDDFLEARETVFLELMMGGDGLIKEFLRKEEGREREGPGDNDERKGAHARKAVGGPKKEDRTVPLRIPKFEVKGLKPIDPNAKKAVGPPSYDPFGGLRSEKNYYVLRDDEYENTWLDQARSDVRVLAGGYDVRDYCNRAIFEAFAGLTIKVGHEHERVDTVAGAKVTEHAARAAESQTIEMIDIT